MKSILICQQQYQVNPLSPKNGMKNSTKIKKKQVMKFYNQIGWGRKVGNEYTDTYLYEDLRPVSAEYRHKCHLRINRYIRPTGKYLLDAASGPVHFPEYLTYSEGYQYRICADISRKALQDARLNLSEKGLYVQCDLVNLPFKEESVDGFVSVHTLFHIPENEQLQGFQELHRVLKPNSYGVIVYTWAIYSLLMAITMPHTLVIKFARWIRKHLYKTKPNEASLYFYVHTYSWFIKNLKPHMEFEIFVWRSVSIRFLRHYIHSNLGGENFLARLYRLEEKHPRFFGRFGEYPLFVIRK